MPSARSLPERMCGVVCTSEVNITLVWPPITSIMAGPPPLNGTCRMLTPAIELEQLAAEMLEAADAGRGILQLARLLLGERDQLLDRIDRQLRD